MPELPDLIVYVEALQRRIVGRRLDGIRIGGPSLMRTAVPPLTDAQDRAVRDVRRIGKHLVFELDEEFYLVLHLMIAGRLHWRLPHAPIPARTGLAALDFSHGSLLITEAGSKKRAALYLVRGAEGLREFDAGGIDPLTVNLEAYRSALQRENHTLKRALTDPRLFSGIGNAYSDEILHDARLSPLVLTRTLGESEIARLFDSSKRVLSGWIRRLRQDAGEGFPEHVTAFRPGMAVHGRYRKPCPVCGSPVQRIVYAENEANYCPTCQTGGRLLADRALSRLLKDDWPRSLEELSKRRAARGMI